MDCQRTGSRLTRGLAIVGASTGLVLSACGSSTATTAVGRPAPSPTQVTIRVTLADTRVTAGTAIKGEAVLINTTSKTVTVESCAADGWLEVGLVNRQITFEPANPAIACQPSVRLLPGLNRFPFSVLTSYQGCTQAGGSSSTNEPLCIATGLPALPAGEYITKVITSGLPAGTRSPRTISVTLLPAPG